MIFLTEFAREAMFKATRIILCEEQLCQTFSTAVATSAVIVPFNGLLIGEGSAEQAIALEELGIPIGLEMIVCRTNCELTEQMLWLVKDSGFPRDVAVVEIANGPNEDCSEGRLSIVTAYQRATEASLS
jgi:hypothetical protein